MRSKERTAIYNAVHEAKKKGVLVEQPCVCCGDAPVVAHHMDYAKPMDVIWLCVICHGDWHSGRECRSRLKARAPRAAGPAPEEGG